MRKTQLAILFLLFGGVSTSYAQSNATSSLKKVWEDENEIDSIRFRALEEYYDITNQAQADSALISLDYYYNLAKEKGATLELYKACKRKGNVNRLKRNYDIAMKAYQEAESLALKLNDPKLQAVIMGNMGNIFISRKDYRQATANFSDALKIYLELGDSDLEAHMLTSLGSVYLIIHNYDLALDYYQKALLILNKRGFEDRRTAIIYINIGWTNYEKGLYEDARNYYEKGLKILQVNNDKFFIAGCYSTLAEIHLEMNQLTKANEYAQKNLALNKELDIESGIVGAEITIAKLTFKTNVDKATQKGEAILAQLSSNTSKEYKRDVYELLYKCYKSQRKLGLSLKMHEQYTIYQDSIQLEKNNFAVAREAVKNDFEIQLYETKLEGEKEKAELKVKQLNRTFAIVSTSIILIAGLLYFFMTTIKKNKKRRFVLLEEIKNLKLKTSKELVVDSNKFELSRAKIESSIKRKLNETDWKVLTILLDDPVISNKEIAVKAFMSIDGIGSSLRRMYDYFEIKESKYKKISLLLDAIKISNDSTLNV